jgi:3-isopropylmalate/(R)-2-methylmalate dehydratase large subunit
MAARFTMANMAVEAGAENGIFEVDEKTVSYLNSTPAHYRQETVATSDPDASYCKIREYDCEALEPQVAAPSLPSNTRPVSEFTDIRIDQALIGSCTNGRIEDLRLAAEVLSGRKVHPDVRLIIIPATQKVYLQALKEGLIEIFISSNSVVSTPTCGPCLGGHMGILARGEVAIATTNRNFIGRMGHFESEIYLANPAITAASAIKGRIAHPDEV